MILALPDHTDLEDPYRRSIVYPSITLESRLR